MDYQDKQITCRDCGQEFTWTANEQEFYASKNLSAPLSCKPCRDKRRNERGGHQGGPRQMFDITCKDCGQPGQVPFEPKTDDVLCRDCFGKSRDN